MADHTCGSMAGHPLGLFTCAASMKEGGPSTNKAKRPPFFTMRGMGRSITWANAASAVRAKATATKPENARAVDGLNRFGVMSFASAVAVERYPVDALLTRPEQRGAIGRFIEPRRHQALGAGVVAGQPAPGNPAAVHKNTFLHGGQSGERRPGRVRRKGDRYSGARGIEF